MNDKEFSSRWLVLEPTLQQQQRMEGKVISWFEARETSLLAEWLSFLNRNPIGGLGLLAAGALSLALVTPISWLSVFVAS